MLLALTVLLIHLLKATKRNRGCWANLAAEPGRAQDGAAGVVDDEGDEPGVRARKGHGLAVECEPQCALQGPFAAGGGCRVAE